VDEVIDTIEQIDWQDVDAMLNDRGYAVVSEFLSGKQCDQLVHRYHSSDGYRKKVIMERYRFGLGEYKYFDHPLPDVVQVMREHIYPKLVPTANSWMGMLKIDKRFSDDFEMLQVECRANHQLKPTPLILKYEQGGFNTLHQDLYGEVFFPLQVAVFLSDPDVDYVGGEFVLMEQRPRAQSKAVVLKPGKGDMLVFTSNFRPVKGAKGYYRANIKHGVSELHRGERYTLGVIFHDAVS
jgi:hypothetical protein